MKKNIATIILVLVTVMLLFFTVYIGWLLKSQGSASPTTIKKTKAGAMTYTKTVLIAQAPSILPTITEILPIISPSATPVPTYLADDRTSTNPSATPENVTPTWTTELTTAVSPTAEPTEELIAKNITVSPTQSELSPTLKVSAGKQLPESGWIGSYATIIALASMIIFFSFLY